MPCPAGSPDDQQRTQERLRGLRARRRSGCPDHGQRPPRQAVERPDRGQGPSTADQRPGSGHGARADLSTARSRPRRHLAAPVDGPRVPCADSPDASGSGPATTVAPIAAKAPRSTVQPWRPRPAKSMPAKSGPRPSTLDRSPVRSSSPRPSPRRRRRAAASGSRRFVHPPRQAAQQGARQGCCPGQEVGEGRLREVGGGREAAEGQALSAFAARPQLSGRRGPGAPGSTAPARRPTRSPSSRAAG